MQVDCICNSVAYTSRRQVRLRCIWTDRQPPLNRRISPPRVDAGEWVERSDDQGWASLTFSSFRVTL